MSMMGINWEHQISEFITKVKFMTTCQTIFKKQNK